MAKTIELKGLRANFRQNYVEGDVVYRKYKSEWHIYVAYRGARGVTSIMRASNDDSFVKSNPELLEALKAASKPFSQIDDKIDNYRPMLANITLTYNATNLKITGYKIDAEGMANRESSETKRKTIYEALETFGVFLSKLI